MKRIWAWGLCLGLGVGAAIGFAAEPLPKLGAESRPAKSHTFGELPAKPPVILGPMDPGVMAEALKLEQDAFQRRLDVCLRLRQVAAQQNNEALLAQVDELEREITAVYHLRTIKLGVKASLRGSFDKLDKKLGTGAAETPLTVAPSEPVPAKATAAAAPFQVVKP